MNNKHIACVLIGLMIFLQLYAVILVNGKAEAIKAEAAGAQATAEAAHEQVNIATIALNGQKAKTDALRKYFQVWLPFLRSSANDERGQTLIEELVRQGGLQAFDKKYNSATQQGNPTIPKTLRADLLFDDDFHKSIEWLGELERVYPAARVTRCRISKGSNANDVKMEMTVDLPIMDESAGGGPLPPPLVKS